MHWKLQDQQETLLQDLQEELQYGKRDVYDGDGDNYAEQEQPKKREKQERKGGKKNIGMTKRKADPQKLLWGDIMNFRRNSLDREAGYSSSGKERQ